MRKKKRIFTVDEQCNIMMESAREGLKATAKKHGITPAEIHGWQQAFIDELGRVSASGTSSSYESTNNEDVLSLQRKLDIAERKNEDHERNIKKYLNRIEVLENLMLRAMRWEEF